MKPAQTSIIVSVNLDSQVQYDLYLSMPPNIKFVMVDKVICLGQWIADYGRLPDVIINDLQTVSMWDEHRFGTLIYQFLPQFQFVPQIVCCDGDQAMTIAREGGHGYVSPSNSTSEEICSSVQAALRKRREHVSKVVWLSNHNSTRESQ